MDKIKNITIVGLGVVGGSYAIALSKLGYNVYGIDLDEKSLESAKKQKAIIDGSTTAEKFFPISDLIVFALYPKQILNYLKDNLQFIKKGAILSDVAGIKTHYEDDINKLIENKYEFVFCHPMAGREKRGFEFATDEVFKGANFIITPTALNKESTLKLVEDLVYEMGFARVKRITPQEHDKLISFTSQLPHAIAVALINSDIFSNTGDFIGDSYRDLTRIANINEVLWTELFLGNKENLLESIENFEEQLDIIKKAIKDDDKEKLKEKFIESSKRREKLRKK